MTETRIVSEERRGPRGRGPGGVHVDPTTLEGNGSKKRPLFVIGMKGPTRGPAAIVAGPGLAPGMPFYVDDDGIGQPAQSDTLQHATAIGVVIDTLPIDAPIVEYALIQALILSLTVVSERTGNPSGFVKGQTYYVGLTPGSLTAAPPADGYSTKVGVALGPNVLAVAIGMPVPPQAEHFTVDAGDTQAITPNTAATFFNAGSGSGTAHATLADGLTDGFQKTFHATNTSEADIDLAPTAFGDGTKITFAGGSDASGAATLAWDASTSLWWIVSMYQGTLS